MLNTRRILIILLWVMVLSGIVTVAAFAIRKKNQSTCKGVEVKIESQVKFPVINVTEIKDGINKTLGYEISNHLIKDINLKQLQDSIRANPWIKEAKLYFDGNDILNIEIKEKFPQARIFDDAGTTYFVDDSYQLLPYRNLGTLQFPVFTNYPSKYQSESPEATKLLASISKMSALISKDDFLTAMVDQVDIDTHHEFIIIPKIGDQIIEFGDSTNCSSKFQKLKLFYGKIIPMKGWNRYSRVALQYKNQIVTTIRDMEVPMMDSMKTLRVINSYAEKSSKQSNEVASQISDEQDLPADQSMVMQSIEREDMPFDENTKLEYLSPNQESTLKKKKLSTPKPEIKKKKTTMPKKSENK